VPEFRPSIGEAVGAAMAHNIRLTDGEPRGRTRRCRSGIFPIRRPTRLRLTFDEPHRELAFGTWTRLAAARGLLRDVEENLEAAQDLIGAIPGELRDPRCLDQIPVLRIHELLSDVHGHGAAAYDEPSAAPDTEADRQRAARSSSPHASAPRTYRGHAQPAAGPATGFGPADRGHAMTPSANVNHADAFGVDVEIFLWRDQSIWADTRTGIPDTARQRLAAYGFARIHHPGIIDAHELRTDLPWPEQKKRASQVAESLTLAGFTVNIDPGLYDQAVVPPILAETRRQQAAATRPSPAARAQQQSTPAHPTPPAPAPIPFAPTLIRRTR
jgi:hypothetical protein